MSETDESTKILILDGLREKATVRYLDKTDWNMFDWLNQDEAIEYVKLHKEVYGICPICGERKCKHYLAEEVENARLAGVID